LDLRCTALLEAGPDCDSWDGGFPFISFLILSHYFPSILQVVSFGIVKFAFEETILNLRAKHGSPKEEGKTETKTVLISSILLVTISFAVSVVLVGPSGTVCCFD